MTNTQVKPTVLRFGRLRVDSDWRGRFAEVPIMLNDEQIGALTQTDTNPADRRLTERAWVLVVRGESLGRKLGLARAKQAVCDYLHLPDGTRKRPEREKNSRTALAQPVPEKRKKTKKPAKPASDTIQPPIAENIQPAEPVPVPVSDFVPPRPESDVSTAAVIMSRAASLEYARARLRETTKFVSVILAKDGSYMQVVNSDMAVIADGKILILQTRDYGCYTYETNNLLQYYKLSKDQSRLPRY